MDARSGKIIQRRWLDDDNKATLQDLADEYGVSAERILPDRGECDEEDARIVCRRLILPRAITQPCVTTNGLPREAVSLCFQPPRCGTPPDAAHPGD